MNLQETIQAAATAAYDEDREMIVGRRPGFGWGHSDAEDAGEVAGFIAPVFRVRGDGVEASVCLAELEADVISGSNVLEVERIDGAREFLIGDTDRVTIHHDTAIFD